MLFRAPALLTIVALLPFAAQGAIVTLNATNVGTRIDSGSPFFGGIAAGWCPCDPIAESRSFLVFDLSSIAGVVTAAELRLDLPASGYDSPQASETYQINEVSSTIAQVIDPFASAAMFTDLGNGTVLGSVVLTNASEGTLVPIALNAPALVLINGQLGGQIAFGGSVTTLAKGGSNELVFLGIDGPNTARQLVLTVEAAVPEPGTFALAGSALLLIFARRVRR